MKAIILATSVLFSTMAFAAPVTFEGTVHKVVPAKKEIYVMSEGKKIELYFTDKTELTSEGAAVEFSTLAKDKKVKVEADKVGKRYTPLKVEVLK